MKVSQFKRMMMTFGSLIEPRYTPLTEMFIESCISGTKDVSFYDDIIEIQCKGKHKNTYWFYNENFVCEDIIRHDILSTFNNKDLKLTLKKYE